MNNPWNYIKLSDYENHMRSESVMQLHALNDMMKKQLYAFPVRSAMIFGVAGGNGLEHIDTEKYTDVYGIDVNPEYLQEVKKRYGCLGGILKCICVDLTGEISKLPSADLIIANLLIEYIGYDCFKRAVGKVKPKYVSCGIQVDTNNGFVSDSPYIHCFDGLIGVHSTVEKNVLIGEMLEIEYTLLSAEDKALPGGKRLIQIDFERAC